MKWPSTTLFTSLTAGLMLFGALPATTNYQLNSYGFGSGGTAGSSTSTYALEGTTGEVSGQNASTTTYGLRAGYIASQQAHVPKLSSFDNGSATYYNKLHFVIDSQNNPTDAQYALSISTDNFVSNINYVKNDLTVGASLTATDYQTHASWGGASGANIVGLLPTTTYYLRVKATQGKYTESGYGPISSAATVGPQLSFSVSTNAVTIGALLPGVVTDASQPINVTFATNAASGGDVYISGKNIGLYSSRASYTLPSTSGDLSALTRGYGAQVTAIAAGSGTFSKVSPYDGASQNVGLTDTLLRRIMTASAPISGGTASVLLKAKSATGDTAANDYTETNTMLASAGF